jgi:DoxX-like family
MTVALTILLAALLAFSAVRKLSHAPQVVQSYARTGVPEDKLNLLAWILLAGAAGLLLGLPWRPLGIAAAAGVAIYFLVAIGFHVRYQDTAHVATPAVIELLAVAVLLSRLAP